MKWRDWQLLIILVLLAYIAVNITLNPLGQQQRLSSRPTSAPSPTSQGVSPGPSLQAVSPSSTPRPTNTSVPTVASTATALPPPTATSTLTPSPTPSPQPQPTATPTVEVIRHIIQRGENLTSIAEQYGVTVQAIVEANDLANADLIYIGQTLIIPMAAQPSPTPTPTA